MTAAMIETKSATNIVFQASLTAFSVAKLKERPIFNSSFNFSKITIYESAVRPIETITPAIPASVNVYPCHSPRSEITE